MKILATAVIILLLAGGPAPQPAAAAAEPMLATLLAEGRRHAESGKQWEALRSFGEALRIAPDNGEALQAIAGILDRNRGAHGAAALAGVNGPRAADMAAARVRWGAEVRPEEVGRRFEGTDRALADLDGLLAKLAADRSSDPALVRRLRLDRVVALRDRVRMAEALAEAEALAPLPAYADQAYADALLYCRRPEAALAAYDRVIAVDPGNIQARYGRVFALVEQEQLTQAFLAADAIVDAEPRFRARAGGPATIPNAEHGYAAQLAAEVRLWGNRLAEGHDRLRPLVAGAPANPSLRRAMAAASAARGWPRAAEQEAQIAASLDPDSLATALALADSALARNRLTEADTRTGDLMKLAPENLAVQRLDRELPARRAWLLQAELRPQFNEGGGSFARGQGYEFGATLASPPLWGPLRLAGRFDSAAADPPEGRVTRHRAGGGLELRTSDVAASLYATGSWGSLPQASLGMAVAVELNDRWTVRAAGEMNSIETPIRALLADIGGDSLSTTLSWRRDERFEASTTFSWLGFSDGNNRFSASGAAVQQLLAHPHFDLSGRLDLYAGWNSRPGGPYFAPSSDLSAAVGLRARHVAWRRYERSLVHILSVDTGLYRQIGFAARWIGVARYEQRWRRDPWSEIFYGITADRRVYDGNAERGISLFLGLRQAL